MTTPKHVSGTIKALEWRAHNDKYDGGRVHYGTGVFGHWYAINRARNREWMVVHHPGSKPHHLPPVASLDAAKAAAQADYEARILAAIQPDPEPQPVAWEIWAASRPEQIHLSRNPPEKENGEMGRPLYATPSSAGTVSVEAAARVTLAEIERQFAAVGVMPENMAPDMVLKRLRALAGEGGR